MPMQLADIKTLVSSEFESLNTAIPKFLETQVPLAEEVSHYLINSGGKRIRPLLVLLMAKACNHFQPQHVTLAAIIEFIHSSTLLHDDVVDNSTKRRGKACANIVWGNPASVLVGDFLYSRSFQMINSLKNFQINDILADATNFIAEGEVLQLSHQHNPMLTEQQYFDIILGKTAKLFECAAALGATLGNLSEKQQYAISQYGLHLGLCFQLVDDVLDYQAPTEILGKNIGDDLNEGKCTLPLLYTLKHANKSQADIIIESIREGTLKDLSAIQQAIAETGAIDYTMAKAQHHKNQAARFITDLPKSDYKEGLFALTELALNRKY